MTTFEIILNLSTSQNIERMEAIVITQNAQRWLRFVIGGGINTSFTFFIYLCLNALLNYQYAYLIAYTIGIVFAYWLNASVVFRVALSWKGFFSYPIVYIIQYLVSALFLGGLVELIHTDEVIAPLVVAVVMIPVSYVLNKFVLGLPTQKQLPSREDIPS